MRDILAAFILGFLIHLFFWPYDAGQSIRKTYNQFQEGWNEPYKEEK